MTRIRLPALGATIAPVAMAALAATMLAVPAASAKDRDRGEKELSELLEGRVAGEPQRCIRDSKARSSRVIDGTAIVYGRGDTIYVQRTRNPEDIDDDDVMVVRRWGSQLCRLDMITTVDRFNGFYTGNVFFEDFVPYKKADES